MKKHAPQRWHHRSDLLCLAKQAMTDHGLQPEFGASVEEQVAGLHEAARESGADTSEQLNALAAHCTQQEDAAQKVERQIRKSDAALLLERRIGEHFDAVVTGNTMVGIWVRIFAPPAGGKLVNGNVELAVGERLRVRLVSTDVERGFIDFQYLGL